MSEHNGKSNKDGATIDKKRRGALKAAGTGAAGIVTAASLPSEWKKPIIDSIVLPAHAQMSPGSGTDSGTTADPGNSGTTTSAPMVSTTTTTTTTTTSAPTTSVPMMSTTTTSVPTTSAPTTSAPPTTVEPS